MASELSAAPAVPLSRPDRAALARAGHLFDATRAGLAAWFAGAARDLPWRRSHRRAPGDLALARAPRRSPYASWIAEIMLQQTQVASAVPHYERWMHRFPDVRALAAAPEDEVLQAWAGLGYYARVRNLHRGAKALVEAGAWPVTAETWERIPGVGPYTAGALASLVFGERAPLLDGNAVRVFSRLLGLDFLPGAGVEEKRFYWDVARRFADADNPGVLNEALMELGALVCVPASPRCDACPLASACTARRRGWQDRLPPPRVRPKTEDRVLVAAVLQRDGKVLLETRGQGFLSGHLMFPLREEADAAALFRRAGPSREAGTVRHVIMHVRYTVSVRVAKAPARWTPPPGGRWVPAAEVDAMLSNALARKVWGQARRDEA